MKSRWLQPMGGVLVPLIVWLTDRCSWSRLPYIASVFSRILYQFWIHRRVIASHNIGLALGLQGREREELVQKTFHHTVLTALEFLKLGSDPKGGLKRVKVEGLEVCEKIVKEGRGLVIATGHLGTFELMGAAVAQRLPLWIIARPQNPPVWGLVKGIREKLGMKVLEKLGSLSAGLSVLRRGEVLGILADQNPGADRGAVTVSFFGRRAVFYKTPALLSARARSFLVFGFTHRLEGGTHRVILKEPIRVAPSQVEEATQTFCRELEREIRKVPEQWWWLHDRWKGETTGVG